METRNWGQLEQACQTALELRRHLLDEERTGGWRLFNGFNEGCKQMRADLYGRTLVLYGYSDDPDGNRQLLDWAQGFYLSRLEWLRCVVQKVRRAADSEMRRGVVSFGEAPDEQVCEHGIWYALDLTLNQDASFYLDTRLLRRWLLDNASGWRVLNTFAGVGSLGVAALAGGASRVVQLDRSRKALALARRSAMLNRLDLGRMKLVDADFFSQVGELKRNGASFDCVLLDPPFFSISARGRVDLVSQSTRLINKLRPLVSDGGRLATVNNALFLSGRDYMDGLEGLCADGYLEIEALIPVPEDAAGYGGVSGLPADPAPFNHATKIVVMKVSKKDRSHFVHWSIDDGG